MSSNFVQLRHEVEKNAPFYTRVQLSRALHRDKL